jgi:RNA polymerase sigma factor (sigma-70 family)
MTAPDGPKFSFAAYYSEHHRRIFHLCLRYSNGDRGLAEDLTQEAFIRLYRHLPNLTAHEDLGGWLYRVATNLALSELRRRKFRLAWFARRAKESTENEERRPDELMEERQLAECALATLATLPPLERVAMSMKILDGKTQLEIAETLSISEGYVSKLIARGWNRVKSAGWRDGSHDEA